MKLLVLPCLLLAFSAHAELYRWVDPQTGSVKFSNAPPPWVGDPEQERRSPRVEVVPYRAPRAAAKSAPEKPAAVAAPTRELEARWVDMLQGLPPAPSPEQLELVRVIAAELDRFDPSGAERRRALQAQLAARAQQR